MSAPIVVSEDSICAAVSGLIAEGRPITAWGLRRHTKAGDADRLLSVAMRLQSSAIPKEGEMVSEKAVIPTVLATFQVEAEQRVASEVRDLFGRAWTMATDLSTRRVAGQVDAARARAVAVESELADAALVVGEGDDRLAVTTAQLAVAGATAVSAEQRRKTAEYALQMSEVRLQEVRASLLEADTRAQSAATTLAEVVERAVVAEGLAQRAADKISALCEAQARSNALLIALDAKLTAETAARARAEAKVAGANNECAAGMVARPKRRRRPGLSLPRGGHDVFSPSAAGPTSPLQRRSEIQ